MYENLNRRDFIKLGLGAATGMTVIPFINSCASITETKEEVENIQWEVNPAIPVPSNGCYLASHYDVVYISGDTGTLRRDGPDKARIFLQEQLNNYGKIPAAFCFTDRIIGQYYDFPTEVSEVLEEFNVIPIIRFHPFIEDFRDIAVGKFDKKIELLADTAKEYGKPFFFVPFPEANLTSGNFHEYSHEWVKSSGQGFREAWDRIYDIFNSIGANKNTIWGLHLMGGLGGKPRRNYTVANSKVDWVGFSIYNITEMGSSHSFSRVLGDSLYWARKTYPNKPVALWEMGVSAKYNQSAWIKDTYKKIKELPRIKLVVYAGYNWGMYRNFIQDDTTHITRRAMPAYKEAISDSYFIGGCQVKCVTDLHTGTRSPNKITN